MLLDLPLLLSKHSLNFSGVVHVGAHEGQERTLYNGLGVKRQWWFEPDYAIFLKLQHNLDLNDEARCFNYALGTIVEVRDLNLASNGGQSSSLLKPKLHHKKHPHVKFSGTKQVHVVPFDHFCDTYTLDPTDFLLVIDVQGFEGEVLKGAANNLSKFKAIVTEINREELYEGCSLIDQLDEYLGERNFVRVETAWTPFGWGDSAYIRKDLLQKVKP